MLGFIADVRISGRDCLGEMVSSFILYSLACIVLTIFNKGLSMQKYDNLKPIEVRLKEYMYIYIYIIQLNLPYITSPTYRPPNIQHHSLRHAQQRTPHHPLAYRLRTRSRSRPAYNEQPRLISVPLSYYRPCWWSRGWLKWA